MLQQPTPKTPAPAGFMAPPHLAPPVPSPGGLATSSSLGLCGVQEVRLPPGLAGLPPTGVTIWCTLGARTGIRNRTEREVREWEI